jgi:hypothetical protein
MATSKRPRYIDPIVRDHIVRLAIERPSWKPAQIEAYLRRQKKLAGRIPTLRTVQRLVAEHRPADASGRWDFAPGAAGDARTVLRVMARVTEVMEGAPVISNAEAEWITALAAANPDLTDFGLWFLARMYRAREAAGVPTPDLDALLAFSPWSQGEEGWLRYRRAADAGWIVEAPAFVVEPLGGRRAVLEE